MRWEIETAEKPATRHAPLLAGHEPPPYCIVNAAGRTPLVLTCDHASHAVPESLGNLGLSSRALERHIGWDIGAAEVTRRLAERFDAPAVLSGSSRLVIDCNRNPGPRHRSWRSATARSSGQSRTGAGGGRAPRRGPVPALSPGHCERPRRHPARRLHTHLRGHPQFHAPIERFRSALALRSAVGPGPAGGAASHRNPSRQPGNPRR